MSYAPVPPAQGLYGSFPVHKKQTRLLCLHNGGPKSRLEGSLFVVDIQKNRLVSNGRKVEYTALSYTWGDGPFSHEIVLNGTPCQIKENLADFLQQCRSEQTSETNLWVDALVINQADPDEKSFHVAQMLRFYENATLTAVWLGNATAHSEAAVSFLQALARNSEGNEKTISDEALKGLQELYNRSYPTRMWIRQEIWGSKNIVVRCGPFSMTLDTFKTVAVESQTAQGGGDGGRPQEGSDGSDADSDMEMYHAPGPLKWLHDKLNINPTQLAAISFLNPRNNMSPSTTGKTGLGHAQKGGRKEILSLIFESTKYQSTDIRDRIFALLGMCHDCKMEVSYRQSPAEVFRSFAKDRILNANCLDPVLDQNAKYGSDSDLNLPSWVPDWRTIELVRSTYAEENLTPFDMDQCFSLENPGMLLLPGFILTTLTKDLPNDYEYTCFTVHWSHIQGITEEWPHVRDMLLATGKKGTSDLNVSHYSKTAKTGLAGDVLVACYGVHQPLLLRPAESTDTGNQIYTFVHPVTMWPKKRDSYDGRKRLREALGQMIVRGKEKGTLQEFHVL